jgi:hypothetical protein
MKCGTANDSARRPDISRPIWRYICLWTSEPKASKPAAWFRFGGREMCVAAWLAAAEVLSACLTSAGMCSVRAAWIVWRQTHEVTKSNVMGGELCGVSLTLIWQTGSAAHQQLSLIAAQIWMTDLYTFTDNSNYSYLTTEENVHKYSAIGLQMSPI